MYCCFSCYKITKITFFCCAIELGEIASRLYLFPRQLTNALPSLRRVDRTFQLIVHTILCNNIILLWNSIHLDSVVLAPTSNGSVNSRSIQGKFILESDVWHFTESSFTSFLNCKIPFTPNSCNVSNFPWNHATFYKSFTQNHEN